MELDLRPILSRSACGTDTINLAIAASRDIKMALLVERDAVGAFGAGGESFGNAGFLWVQLRFPYTKDFPKRTACKIEIALFAEDEPGAVGSHGFSVHLSRFDPTYYHRFWAFRIDAQYVAGHAVTDIEQALRIRGDA